MKKALVIGIDHYPDHPLSGCVNDAISMAAVLEKNGDGSPNFSVRRLISSDMSVTTSSMSRAIADLFQGDAETVLLYYSGHGVLDTDTNAGHLVSQNFSTGAWGYSMSDLLTLANRAHPHIKSTVIILDCCHAGFAGQTPALDNRHVSSIGAGVTILTACSDNESAVEIDGRGLSTTFLLDGLEGASADICGRITPASLYSHVDQVLGPWEQRPVYKANVKSFVTLRNVAPKIPLDVLRKLPAYFPDPAYVFPLDPSYEPDRNNIPVELQGIPVNEHNARIFKELQACNRHGLVVPDGAEHMYYAAIQSKGCRLTALGAHYRMLAEKNRI